MKLAQIRKAKGGSQGSHQPAAQAAGRDKLRAWLVVAALTPSHTKTRNYKHFPVRKKIKPTRECGRETTVPAGSKEKNLDLVEMRGETLCLGRILMPSLLHASKPKSHQQTRSRDLLENRGTPIAGQYACFSVQGRPCCWGWPAPIVYALKTNVLAVFMYHRV